MTIDLIDVEPRYVDHRDLSGWERFIGAFFESHVFPLLIPSHGQVVEMGVARGINFARLCEVFGPERCEGFDVVDYSGHARVRTVDVRTLGRHDDRPVALGWNDLSSWEHSPRSKRAGFEFLTRNLVEDGLYIDADFEPDTLESLDLTGLELVVDHPVIKVWRRVEGGLPSPDEELAPGEPPLAWWQWLDRLERRAPVVTRLGVPTFVVANDRYDRARAVLRGLTAVRAFGQGARVCWWQAGPWPASRAEHAVVLHLGDRPRSVRVDGQAWHLEPGNLLFVPRGSELASDDAGPSAIAMSHPPAGAGRIVLDPLAP